MSENLAVAEPPVVSISSRARWAAAAFAVYVLAICLSNYLITHIGIPAGPGTHLSEVGFGLLAPSGVWAAGVSFPARDVVQRTGGRWLGVAAILLGAAISWKISSPVIAVASGGTYLISESLDMLVYTPLQKRWFVPAVVASGCVALVADSVVFLHWAGLPSGWNAVLGLCLGKFWAWLAALPVTWAIRRRGPVAVAA
jgi:queuosine precursor transporter